MRISMNIKHLYLLLQAVSRSTKGWERKSYSLYIYSRRTPLSSNKRGGHHLQWKVAVGFEDEWGVKSPVLKATKSDNRTNPSPLPWHEKRR
ncbi:hypothetical protein CDAR_556481 [Caerostris darwini]|uniref:Uncharacterized protein n=1 Tax=Caerostris darwini TaxID=1538125 RepID=A0AAV4SVI1_9ARAC|nr:hypothetical protein CDAR_556481 [Caerostris darwini]